MADGKHLRRTSLGARRRGASAAIDRLAPAGRTRRGALAERLSALETRVVELETVLNTLRPKPPAPEPVRPERSGPRCPGCRLEVASTARGRCPWCGLLFSEVADLCRKKSR